LLDIDSTSFRQRPDFGTRRRQTPRTIIRRILRPTVHAMRCCRCPTLSKNAKPRYRFERARNKKPASLCRKKTLFREEQGRQDGTVEKARGCLPTYDHQTYKALAYFKLHLLLR
jgi:hypothetical protein